MRRPLAVPVWLAGSSVALIAFALSLSAVAAASAGDLEGVVRTESGTPLPQIALQITGPGGRITAASGPEGRYRAAGLAPGTYTVTPEAPGLVLDPPARAEVGSGDTRLDLVLAAAPVAEHVVVAATRGEAPLSSLGVSASVLDAARIDAREASSLVHLVQDMPGVAVARAGGHGLQASAFVRGGESRFARVLVDGVPLNEPGGFANLGSLLPLELERVELVRGAASSLYGTDALAGVIQMVTRRAAPGEALGLRLEADAGSFAWRRAQAGLAGRVRRVDWNAGVVRLETDNQEPNSAFEETAAAAALGLALSESSGLRAVARVGSSRVGTPGPTAFGRPDLDAAYEWDSLVLGVELRHARSGLVHTLHAGLSDTDQLSLDPLDSGSFVPTDGERVAPYPYFDFPNQGYQNDTRRLSAGYQLEAQGGRRHLVTAGAELEHETGAIGLLPSDPISPVRTNAGAYLQDRVLLGRDVFVTLGARVERNDSYGTAFVPRAALAWRVRGGADATTLRLSAGAGIKEPSFLESFGVSFYAQGNPDLEPERSRTFDLGVEQRLFQDRLLASATLYHHEYRDQITYQVLDDETYQGSFVNLGRTRGRGLELSLEASPLRSLRLAAQYTFLDGEILESGSVFDPVYAEGQGLLRRPRHQASLQAWGEHGRLGGGATLVLVGERADSDFVGLGLATSPGYARLDARARLRLAAGLEVFAVAENLLDRAYQEVLGFPALGRAVRAGLRWRSGSAARP